MISLAEPTVTGKEIDYIRQCLDDGWLSSVGPFVDTFEARLAELTQRQHALAVSSGTAALHLALRAVGVRPGDLVLTQSFTFIATANAVAAAGADPWFVDSDPATWNMGVIALEACLAQCQRQDGTVIHRPSGRRVAAILPVQILGLCADIDKLGQLAAQWGLPMVVDAAEAVGAVFHGKPAAAYGVVACLSFNGNKVITTGAGGAIVTDDPALARACRHIATQAKVDNLDHLHDAVGCNYRMAAVNAAIGLAQLDALPDFLAAKQRIARRYNQAFAGNPAIAAMPQPADHSDWPWLYSLLLPGGDGRAVVQELNRQGIGARRLWRPLHVQPPYLNCPRQPDGLAVAERFYAEGLSLPSSVRLSGTDQDRVIDTLVRLTEGKTPAPRQS